MCYKAKNVLKGETIPIKIKNTVTRVLKLFSIL